MRHRKAVQHTLGLILATEYCSALGFMGDSRNANQDVRSDGPLGIVFSLPTPPDRKQRAIFLSTYRVPVLTSSVYLIQLVKKPLNCIMSIQCKFISDPFLLPVTHQVFPSLSLVPKMLQDPSGCLYDSCFWQPAKNTKVFSDLKTKHYSVCYQIYLKPQWAGEPQGSLDGSMEHLVLQKHWVTEWAELYQLSAPTKLTGLG